MKRTILTPTLIVVFADAVLRHADEPHLEYLQPSPPGVLTRVVTSTSSAWSAAYTGTGT